MRKFLFLPVFLLLASTACAVGPSSDATGATDASTPAKTPTNASATGQPTHIFQSGDTLWSLAARYLGDGNRWPEIAQLNGIGDPSAISNGTPILIPGGALTATPKPPATTWAPTTTVVCTIDRANALAGEVNLLATDYMEIEASQFGEEIVEFFDEKDRRLARLENKVDEWGRCLSGAPSSVRAYQAAFSRWIDASWPFAAMGQECYFETFDVETCTQDILNSPTGQRWAEAATNLSELGG
jgi:hypothetical protein